MCHWCARTTHGVQHEDGIVTGQHGCALVVVADVQWVAKAMWCCGAVV